MQTPSRVAGWSLRLGLAGLALCLLGPLAIHLGPASPFVGFRLFGLGLLLGLMALVLGLVGLWRTRPAAGRDGRERALAGACLGGVLVGLVLVANAAALSLPPINDITTDPDDPPAFVAIAELPASEDRDLAYPGDPFASAQRSAYPDLAPLRLAQGPQQVFEDARRAAHELGWEIVAEAPQAGRLEATQTTRIFRFVDDIVVRIRPAGSGSVVDVRSKSRDGRGDLGANAARIRAFLAALSGQGAD